MTDPNATVAGWAMTSVPAASPPTLEEVTLPGERSSDFFIPSFLPDFVVAPNGSAFAADLWVDGQRRLVVRPALERDYRTLIDSAGSNGMGPVFSPDGEWIAYFGSGEGLMTIPASGGAPQPVVVDGTGTPMLPLDWSADGSILFLDGTQWAVRTVPNTGGDSRLVYEDVAYSGQILPGGNVVLGEAGVGVRFVDVARDSSWVIVPEALHPRYVNGHLFWADNSGTVWANGFDPSAGRLDEGRGIVLEGVTIQNDWARYDVSENGTLVYSTGGTAEWLGFSHRRFVTVGLDGSVTPAAVDR